MVQRNYIFNVSQTRIWEPLLASCIKYKQSQRSNNVTQPLPQLGLTDSRDQGNVDMAFSPTSLRHLMLSGIMNPGRRHAKKSQANYKWKFSRYPHLTIGKILKRSFSYSLGLSAQAENCCVFKCSVMKIQELFIRFV